MKKILIIEDDDKIANLLKVYLENNDFIVTITKSAKETKKLLQSGKTVNIDAILLDLMLPDEAGEVLLEEIKEDSDIPILIISAKTQIQDKLAGLSLGADDYITKPFNPNEVVLRLKNILRRYEKIKDGSFKSYNNGRVKINEYTYELIVDDKKVNLTATEFKILLLLINNRGKILTREEIIKKALGYDYEGYDRTVDAHIKNIRNKIKEVADDLNCIQTVYSLGYRCTCQIDD